MTSLRRAADWLSDQLRKVMGSSTALRERRDALDRETTEDAYRNFPRN